MNFIILEKYGKISHFFHQKILIVNLRSWKVIVHVCMDGQRPVTSRCRHNRKFWKRPMTFETCRELFVLTSWVILESFGALPWKEMEIWRCPQFSRPESIWELWTNVSRCVTMRTRFNSRFSVVNEFWMLPVVGLRSYEVIVHVSMDGQRPVTSRWRHNLKSTEVLHPNNNS